MWVYIRFGKQNADSTMIKLISSSGTITEQNIFFITIWADVYTMKYGWIPPESVYISHSAAYDASDRCCQQNAVFVTNNRFWQ